MVEERNGMGGSSRLSFGPVPEERPGPAHAVRSDGGVDETDLDDLWPEDEQGVSGPDPAPDTAVESSTEPEQIVLFSLDGRDYYVPKRIGPNVAMAYMRDIRKRGLEYARAGILERLIGKEGLDALADFDGLTEEDLDSLMKAVDKHVLGPLERSGKGSGFVLRKSGG
jgi:hypothetical protein